MKILLTTISVLAIACVFLKAFTYEYHYPDDPTCGIALRYRPSLANRVLLVNRTISPEMILVQDENSYIGQGVYRRVVGWVYLPLTAGCIILLLALRKKMDAS